MRSHASLQRRLGRCLQRLNAACIKLRVATVEAHNPVAHPPADSVLGRGHAGTDVNGTSLLAPVPVRSSGMPSSLPLIPTCAQTERHNTCTIIPNSLLRPPSLTLLSAHLPVVPTMGCAPPLGSRLSSGCVALRTKQRCCCAIAPNSVATAPSLQWLRSLTRVLLWHALPSLAVR
jgi:hypothetical protein